jgi:regulatory protein
VSPRAGTGASGRRRDVHDRALGLLAVRQRSTAELRRRLLGAGFGAQEVAAELLRLEHVGLIDDHAFARAVVEHAVRSRGEGRRAVHRRLASAGVDRAVADQVVGDLIAGDEAGRALELAVSRARRLATLPPEKAFGRLSGFLARRGYPPELACWAARKALALETVEG